MTPSSLVSSLLDSNTNRPSRAFPGDTGVSVSVGTDMVGVCVWGASVGKVIVGVGVRVEVGAGSLNSSTSGVCISVGVGTPFLKELVEGV